MQIKFSDWKSFGTTHLGYSVIQALPSVKYTLALWETLHYLWDRELTCVRNKACHWHTTARFSSSPGCNLGFWLSSLTVWIQGPTRSSHGVMEHARRDAGQTAPCNSSLQCGLSWSALYLTHEFTSMFAYDHTYINVLMQTIRTNCTILYCKKQI